MRADRVELSWDAAQSNWLLRIEGGEEVIRRHCAVATLGGRGSETGAQRMTADAQREFRSMGLRR